MMDDKNFDEDDGVKIVGSVQTAQDLPVMTDLQDLSPSKPEDMLSGFPEDLDD